MSGSLQKKYNLYLVYNLNLWGGGGGGEGIGGLVSKGRGRNFCKLFFRHM